MRNKKWYISVGILILFSITFYLVEFSPWSSTALKEYNNGYGTFDMKAYNSNIVYEVIQQMQPKGMEIYKSYLICDYLFVLSFGALQIILILSAYKWTKRKMLISFAVLIPVLRGIFDLIENTIFMSVLTSYPDRLDGLINIAKLVTQMKLGMIGVWSVMLICGFILKQYSKKKKPLVIK